MEVHSLDISGLKLIVPQHIRDESGYSAEVFRADMFARLCGDEVFVQDNESFGARAGTVRALHFQTSPFAQGKLVRCTAGALYVLAVDIRHGSPTFGRWIGETLTPDNGKQFCIPPGFAHSFCTLVSNTVIAYKVTAYYSAECETGTVRDDPDIGVRWPDVADGDTLYPKDRKQPTFAELSAYFSWSE